MRRRGDCPVRTRTARPARRRRSRCDGTRCWWSPLRAAAWWTATRPPPRSSSRSSATRRASRRDVPLPEPLAEPRLDFRVDRASALAYEVKEGEYIQIIDVQGRQCSDFLAFHRAKLESGLERGMDGVTTRTLMGAAYPQPGPLLEVLRRGHGPARAGGAGHGRPPRHVRARVHAPLLRGHGLPRPRELHGQLQRRGGPVRDRAARRLGGRQLLLQHPDRGGQRARLGRAVVAAGRLRHGARADRPRVRVVGVPGRHRPGERVGVHRHPRARLLAREPLLGGHRPSRDPGGRASHDQGNGVPPADQRAHRELPGVPRLLAAALLQQRGRDRRVLGVPREGRGHGPLAAAEVGGARPRRGDADPGRGHARRAPAGGGPGGLHGDVQRDRRDDRRRHRVPARRRQLPLHRRRRVRRRVAEGAGRAARPQGVREAVHRPAPQRGRPGPELARDHEGADLDAADAAVARGAQVVPLPGGADRRLPGDPGGGVAHRLHGRARLRGVLPPGRRRGRLGRDLGGRAAARAEAARARGARHDPDRGGADLRRLRVRRPGGSVRGRHRLHGEARLRGRLHRQGGADRALRAPAAQARRASSSTATRRPGTATRCTWGASAWAWSRAGRARPRCARTSRCAGCPCSTRTNGTAVEVGKLDGLQKRIPAQVVGFPFYDPKKERPRS